jgi:hypothetical protein
MGYTHNMKTIADSRRRITLPNTVNEGDVFDVEEPQSGRFVVIKLAKPQQPKVKLVRKDGLLLGYTGRTITWEETRKAMDDFP